MNKFNKLNYFLIAIVFILSFTKGLLELLGFPETILQLFIELLIFLLFFNSLFFIVKRKKLRGPGLRVNFFLLVIILISYITSGVSEIKLIFFIRKLIIYYLFFYALFNINLSIIYKDKLVKLIITLFIIQVIASFIKISIYGESLEKVVGTMTYMEGSLATIMPLLAISYLISNYLYEKQYKYIIWLISFIAVGFASGKRAIIFYVVILFLYLVYMYARPKYLIPKKVIIQKLFPVLIFIFIALPTFISLTPSLNPEHKVGGSIDIKHLEYFIKDYQTLDLGTGVEGDGRADAPFVAFDRLSNGGMISLLLGFGPGELVQSSFLEYNNPLLEKYNIGYGGNIGMVWICMQIGYLGLLIISVFHFLLFLRIRRLYLSRGMSTDCKVYLLTSIGLVIVFFIDIYTYSSLLLYSPGVTLAYYFTIYYSLTSCIKNTEKTRVT